MSYEDKIRMCLLLVVVVVVALVFTRCTSRQHFLNDLNRVEVGMTVLEVEHIMDGYMKGRGAKWQFPQQAKNPPNSTQDSTPDAQFTGTITYRHSNDSRYDSDWGVVTFQAGRVTSAEFMPD